jgi:hypothetical protein
MDICNAHTTNLNTIAIASTISNHIFPLKIQSLVRAQSK